MDKEIRHEVLAEEAGERIDKFLTQAFPQHTRSYYQNLLAEGRVQVNGKAVKANYRLRAGDAVMLSELEPKTLEVLPENLPLDILYEDEDIIVVNKGKGMVVHPAPGHESGTLVNALMYHCKNLSTINGVIRPGIVHRIDKDTTGTLVVCKNDASHVFMAQQIAAHSITRLYRGIVNGRVTTEEGTIHAPIGRHPVDRKKMAVNSNHGKDAITHYKVLEQFEKETYMEFRLETGRTHQIRVHMASIGHPILGDVLYGPAKCRFHLQGQCLHARTLGFLHPRTKEYMEFNAPLPEYFEELLLKL